MCNSVGYDRPSNYELDDMKNTLISGWRGKKVEDPISENHASRKSVSITLARESTGSEIRHRGIGLHYIQVLRTTATVEWSYWHIVRLII